MITSDFFSFSLTIKDFQIAFSNAQIGPGIGPTAGG